MTQTLPVVTTTRRRRPLPHLVAAAVLGVFTALIGAPVVLAGLFGGWVTASVGLALVAAVVAGAAIGLDSALGPGRGGRAGVITRGLVLGIGGTVTGAVLALVALTQDVGDDLPVRLRYAAAALPFLAIAGLQWRGAVRIVTAVVLTATVAAVGVPRVLDDVRQGREDLVMTEIGTTAHPWVTHVEGFAARAPQSTGTGYLWSDVADAGGAPVVNLLRMPDEAAPGGDPCAGVFYTPDGDFSATSCTTDDGVTWRRTADGYWQQLIRRIDGTWVGAIAAPDVPERLLEEALGNARPMTDDEYEDWLDAVLPSSSGH